MSKAPLVSFLVGTLSLWNAILSPFFIFSPIPVCLCVSTRLIPRTTLNNYISPSKGPSRTAYTAHIRSMMDSMNVQIPTISTNTFRFLMYNLNYIRDVNNKVDNLSRMRNDLNRLQATVVAFHQVPMKGHPLREALNTTLNTLGYKRQVFHHQHKATFGTMVASRLHLRHHHHQKLDSSNALMMVDISVGERLIGIIMGRTIHGSQSARVLGEFLKQVEATQLHDHILVAWDYNGSGDLLSETTLYAPFRDVFRILQWTPPALTMWKNQVRDIVLYQGKPERRKELLAAYQYLTLATSHLPLVVDINVPTFERILIYFEVPRGTAVLLGGAITLLLVTTSIGVYHWVKAKLDPYY